MQRSEIEKLIGELIETHASGCCGKHDNLKRELDSIDFIELMMEVEDRFGIELPDEDIDRLHTTGDLVEYVERKLAEDGR